MQIIKTIKNSPVCMLPNVNTSKTKIKTVFLKFAPRLLNMTHPVENRI